MAEILVKFVTEYKYKSNRIIKRKKTHNRNGRAGGDGGCGGGGSVYSSSR